MIDEETIQRIVERILLVAQPKKIILFGSAAADQITKDSDIDLLVIQRKPGNMHDKCIRIWDILRGLDLQFDVIVMSNDRFEESKNVIGGAAYPANKYGKVIYEIA